MACFVTGRRVSDRVVVQSCVLQLSLYFNGIVKITEIGAGKFLPAPNPRWSEGRNAGFVDHENWLSFFRNVHHFSLLSPSGAGQPCFLFLKCADINVSHILDGATTVRILMFDAKFTVSWETD